MAKKKKSILRKARIALAAIVFFAFVLLLLDLGGLFHKSLGFLPALEFWPAVLAMNTAVALGLLVLTGLFGRWYCSVLCPLGILQDGEYRIRTLGRKKRLFAQKWRKPKNILRYSILCIFIIVCILGPGAIAYYVEPYSIFGRMVTSFKGGCMLSAIISAVTFIVIALFVWKGGRSWCNTVCPVGSILSLASRWSVFRPVIDTDKCVNCGMCGKGCRASCIDTENHRVDMSRCVLCLDCLDNCSTRAISYKAFLPLGGRSDKAGRKISGKAGKQGDGQQEEITADEGRRRFLSIGTLAAATLAQGCATNGIKRSLAALEEKSIPDRKVAVVPPGAISLKHFTDHCIACHLCVSACQNKVLTPSVQSGNFMQPTMVFSKGFCRPECTDCSQVCPTSAISPVTPEQKTSISIGHAVYIPENCVVITDNVSCGNCARHCIAGAISMVLTENGRIPSINPERCIGCGRCEYVCPSRPVSAIYVEGNEIHREV